MFGGLANRLFDTLEKAKRGDNDSLRKVAGGLNLVGKLAGKEPINVDKFVADKGKGNVELKYKTRTLPSIGFMPARQITTLDKRQIPSYVDNIHSDLQNKDRQKGAVGLLPGATFQGSSGKAQPESI